MPHPLTYFTLIKITTPETQIPLSKKELRHSRFIVSELKKSITKEKEPGFHLHHHENDFLFLISWKEGGEAEQEILEVHISSKIKELFSIFENKKQQLQKLNLCPCHSCSHCWDYFLHLYIDCHKSNIEISKKGYNITTHSLPLLTHLALEEAPAPCIHITQRAHEQLHLPSYQMVESEVEFLGEQEKIYQYYPYAFSDLESPSSELEHHPKLSQLWMALRKKLPLFLSE